MRKTVRFELGYFGGYYVAPEEKFRYPDDDYQFSPELCKDDTEKYFDIDDLREFWINISSEKPKHGEYHTLTKSKGVYSLLLKKDDKRQTHPWMGDVDRWLELNAKGRLLYVWVTAHD